MLRKFVVILTMLLCSMATPVFALGLGTLSVESALNQPLRARIELVQLADTRLQDVSVRMASPDDFRRFDIERVGFLSNVRFQLEATATGNVLILSSNQLVREPYLNFVLETRWPSGRLLSNYTILLDLPVFDDQAATAILRQPISPILRAPEPAQDAAQPLVTPPPGAPAVNPATSSGQINSGADLQPEILELVAPEEQAAAEPEPEPEAPADLVAADPVAVVVEELQDTPVPAAPESPVEDQSAPAVALEEESQTDVVVADAAAPEQEPQIEAAVEEELPVEVAIEEEPPVEVAIEEELPAEVAVEEELPTEVAVEEVPPVEVAVEEDTPVAADAAFDAAEPEQQRPESIETTSADTLSAIAMQVRPDTSVSMQQTMLAIQQLNPDAFANGNINRMRSGEILRIPSLAEIQGVDARQAIDEVASQSQQFAAAGLQPLAAPADASPVQDGVQQGRLSVVSSDAEPIDVSSAASAGLNDEENAELDRRIAELENQLAISQEEADVARSTRAEFESRLQELESQIAATQEIIRLQDIRLAQLQQSLAAAAEIAEQEAALAAAQAETAQPVAPPATTNTVDELIRILSSNNLFVIFAVALIILLLVLLLLRRSNAAKQDDEEIDEIAEQAFDGSEAGRLNEKETAEASEYQNFDAAELDSELSEILGTDDDSSYREETQDQDEVNIDQLATDDFDVEIASSDAATKQDAEIDTLLDDMGIDSFDDIDDEVSSLAVTDDETDSVEVQQAEVEEIEILELDEPDIDEVEILEPEEPEVEETAILDLDEPESEEVEILEPYEPEIEEVEIPEFAEQEAEELESLESDMPEVEEVEILEPEAPEHGLDLTAASEDTAGEETADASENPAEEFEHFNFNADESIEGRARDAEELAIDTLEFENDPVAATSEEPQSESREEIDLETFSFVAGEQTLVEDSDDEEAEIETADDSNTVDFGFDATDVSEETSSESTAEKEEELETFEFELDETASSSTEEVADEIVDSTEMESDDVDSRQIEAATEMTEEESLDVAEELPKVELELADDDEDDLEFLSDDFDIDLGPIGDVEEIELLPDYDESESATKLELAYAYQKMGDPDGAKEILREVINEGNEEQKIEAKGLLESINGSAK